MKKHLLVYHIIPVLLAFTGVWHYQQLDARPHQVYARSFMSTRPAYQHMSMQQSLWHSIIYNKRTSRFSDIIDDHDAIKTGPHNIYLTDVEVFNRAPNNTNTNQIDDTPLNNRFGGALRTINFMSHSIPMHKTAHYFLPPCRDTVLVAGDKTAQDVKCKRDIRAEWLGLDPEFQGSFSLMPTERQYGFTLEYNQDIGAFFDFSLLENYWISISVPVTAVYHSLNFHEQVLSAPPAIDGADNIRTLYHAFNQRGWEFAKLNECSHVIRPTEIRVQIGSPLVSRDYFQFAYNTIFIAPMGNKQNARELFPAIAGNNQHFAFGAAIFFQFPLNYDIDNYGICFFMNLESVFNIRNTQLRTFDLKGKPWSRYLLYNQRCSTANDLPGQQYIPGVNILTREVLIRPYGVFDFSMGWRYISTHVEAEFGYNIWGKSNEKAELKRPWFHPCQYQGIYGIAGSKPNTTASMSTIAQRAPDDMGFVPIDLVFDIDTHSGESASALNHKVHGSVGLHREYTSATVFFAGGAHIDIPQKNGALRTWGVWITYGASF